MKSQVAFHLMAASVASESLLSMTRAEARPDEGGASHH
jgi:hypothetical protein